MSEYFSINLSFLKGSEKVPFNVYIYVNEKYILYIREGDFFGSERIDKIQDKKLDRLFVKNSDLEVYNKFKNVKREMAFDKSTSTPLEKRAEMAGAVVEGSVDEVFENPESKRAYENLESICRDYAGFLDEDERIVKMIIANENKDGSLTQHCLNVSTLSMTMAGAMGITDEKKLQHLNLGAALHDIGHNYHEVLYTKKMADMTEPELAKYKMHTQLALKKLRELGHFNPTVLSIIAQHEECADGSGYPDGLVQKNIDELALIVGVCNQLDLKVSLEGIEPKQVAKAFMVDMVGKYPLDYLKFLSKIVSS